ncbi:MAG: DUF4199 domain-containing protein [Prevotellaceae bacterium]|jgi:hypothetical protein|nr:DUF4199 domain-containing protein [Prevotellaceae bacterium]
MKNIFITKAGEYALYLILTTIIFQLLPLVLPSSMILSFLLTIVKLTLTIGILVYAVKNYVKELSCSTYGNTLWFGTFTSILSCIVIALWTFFYFRFFISESNHLLLEQQIEQVLSQLGTDKSVEEIMNNIPVWASIGTFILYSFVGFIYSLIIAAFIKKEAKHFV